MERSDSRGSAEVWIKRQSGLWTPGARVEPDAPVAATDHRRSPLEHGRAPQLGEEVVVAEAAASRPRHRLNVSDPAMVVTALTAISYGLGVMRVGQFAGALGVSASELDVEFRDYVVLATVPLIPILVSIVVALGVWRRLHDAYKAFRPSLSDLAPTLAIGLGALGGLIWIYGSPAEVFNRVNGIGYGDPIDAIYVSVLAGFGIGALAAALEAKLSNSPSAGRMLGGYALLLLFLPTLTAQPANWGRSLLDESELRPTEEQTAYGLDMIFEPRWVRVAISGKTICALRVSDRVMLVSGRAIVLSGSVQTESYACDRVSANDGTDDGSGPSRLVPLTSAVDLP